MTSQLGAAISPLIVVPIQVRYGWRASFWLFGILGVVWAAVWFAWFRDSPAEKAGVTPAELREIGVDGSGAHGGLPWSMAFRNATFWRVAIIGTCYVSVIAFFQSWLQTYSFAATATASRRWCSRRCRMSSEPARTASAASRATGWCAGTA